MRKILLNVAISLDGRIEGPGGEIDWCYTDQDYGMTEFLGRVDTIMMGRRAYQALVQQGPIPWPDKKIVIVSRSMPDPPEGVKVINERGIAPLKMRKKKQDIWLFGGAQLFTALLGAGLVDELHLAIHPIILGPGKPLVDGGLHRRIGFDLLDTKTWSTGLVQQIYRLSPFAPGGEAPAGD